MIVSIPDPCLLLYLYTLLKFKLRDIPCTILRSFSSNPDYFLDVKIYHRVTVPHNLLLTKNTQSLQRVAQGGNRRKSENRINL